MSYQYDVFISYRSSNRDWVKGSLLHRLEKEGLKVCIDYRDFTPGKPAIQNIKNAIANSRKTLLILTPSYLESGWTGFERELLRTSDLTNKQEQLIPLLKEKCELPPEINLLTYLDFSNIEGNYLG